MKIGSFILLLFAGMVAFGVEVSYRRGVDAMVAGIVEKHGLWSYYYGIGVLGRHGGKVGGQATLSLSIQLMNKEEERGLLAGIRDVVCSGEAKPLTKFGNADGGWPVEQGGQSEMWGTLLAMECLLDMETPPNECGIGWKWLMKRIEEDGCVALCGHGGHELRVVCQLVKVGGLARRQGWGLNAESRDILDELVLWLERQWCPNDGANDLERCRGIYDKALALKGLCLLGLHDGWDWLACWLARSQSGDGRWHDDSIADDWLTTCAVVDALGTFLAATKEEEGVHIGWKDYDGEEATFGAREFAAIELEGVGSGKVVTLEIYRDGELIDFVYAGEVADGHVSWFTGGCEAGDYEMQVVVWDENGRAWLGEAPLFFKIVEDMSCRRFKWDVPGHDRILYLSEGLETDLEVSWDYDGNMDGLAALEWNLSMDGVDMDGGEVEVELSRKSRRCQCMLKRNWSLMPTLEGVYELTGRLVTGQTEYVCMRKITVVKEKGYEVENDVGPRRITLGTARLRHTLKIRCFGEEAAVVHEAGFSVKPDERRLVDEDGEELEIELSDIYDSEGRQMMEGWLAVHSYYGNSEGDMDLHARRKDGFLCGVKVTGGKARFCMKAAGKMKKGVVSVSVYQLDGLDAASIGTWLGDFDVHWVWR